jgi:ABC-2 type transport system permease protein
VTLRPASWPWLLRHEMRLAWRHTGGARLGILLVLGGVLWAAMHLAIYFLLRVFDPAMLGPGLIVVLAGGVWFIFTLMLSHSITMSVGAFFDRGDLDLLLASPLPPRHVFVVRGLGIAVSVTTIYALLLLPFAHMGLVTGRPQLLAVYPALAALGLLASAIGMAATLALVRLLGARRARTAAQVLGALVGAAVFLLIQANNLFGHERIAGWIAALRAAAQGSGLLGPNSPLWWPFLAMLGRPLPLFALVAIGTGAFVVVVNSMARRFLAGTQESMTDAQPAQAANLASARFRSGLWRIVLIKEWKLIWRDPQLVANTLLQTLYLLPLVFVWRGHGSAVPLLVPAVIIAAATLASGLAWVTVAAEDAPELIAAAPLSLAFVRRMKLVAALLPVWIIISPFIVFLALSSPESAAVFALCVAGATISSALGHIALPRSGKRRDMRRRGKGNMLGGLLELATTLGWSALAWSLLAAPRYALLPLIPALAGPLLTTWLGRTRRREFASA